MGWAVRDVVTGKFLHWQRHDPPAFDSETQELVELDESPEIVTTAVLEVSPLQAKIALHRRGDLDNVEQVIDLWGPEAELAWRNATVFRRDSPMLLAIAAAIPEVGEDLDAIFTEAAAIEV